MGRTSFPVRFNGANLPGVNRDFYVRVQQAYPTNALQQARYYYDQKQIDILRTQVSGGFIPLNDGYAKILGWAGEQGALKDLMNGAGTEVQYNWFGQTVWGPTESSFYFDFLSSVGGTYSDLFSQQAMVEQAAKDFTAWAGLNALGQFIGNSYMNMVQLVGKQARDAIDNVWKLAPSASISGNANLSPTQAGVSAAALKAGVSMATTTSAIIIAQLAQLQVKSSYQISQLTALQGGIGAEDLSTFTGNLFAMQVLPGGTGMTLQQCLGNAGGMANFMNNYWQMRSILYPDFVMTPGGFQEDYTGGVDLSAVYGAPHLSGESDLAFLERVVPSVSWQTGAPYSWSVWCFAGDGGTLNDSVYVYFPGESVEEFYHLWDYTPSSGPPVRNGITDFTAILAIIPFQY